MRANRTTRIGIALLLVGLLLWGLYAFFRSLSFGPDTKVVENNSTTNNAVVPVSLTSGKYAVLAVNLPERTIITPAMFRMQDRPSSLPEANFITDPDSQAVGFVTNRPLRARQPLRKTDFSGHISEVGIAGALQRPDLRALVVPITGKPALHPLVRVGDHIDVVAAFEGQESRTIVEDVRVLAVDVLGSDYPPYSVAMRGSYKAPPKGDPRPVTPTVNAQGTPLPPGAPPPGPTPTPAPAAAPAPPTPALTLELTPVQANSITLAQNANAAIDFLIRPSTFLAPGGTAGAAGGTPTGGDPIEVGPTTEVRVAAVTRPQLAPYAARLKNAAARTGTGTGGATRTVSTSSSSGDRRPPRSSPPDFGGYNSSTIPPPVTPTTPGTTPWVPDNTTPSRPSTYEIPIYADGKLLRRDTVKDPNAVND